MSLTPQTAQFLSQLGTLTYVDVSAGPTGPHGAVAYDLIPTSGWHQGQRFPHSVEVELAAQGFKKTTIEGVQYYLVPDEKSTNVPGTVSHYAQRTSVADLQNPPGGGVNRALENVDYSDHVAAPEAVKKYVKDTDNWEDARKKVSEEDERVRRQIGH